jgi:chemotaxis-related protein WspB
MLVLMCHAGDNRYAVDSASVVEVVPCVNVNTIAGAPEWLAGVFAHRGVATPLLDLTRLLTGQPCPLRWNSRIMLTRIEMEDVPEQLGLLAERVTTAEIDTQATAAREANRSSAMESLGPILLDERGMFQLVDPSRLLSGDRLSVIQPILSEGTP